MFKKIGVAVMTLVSVSLLSGCFFVNETVTCKKEETKNGIKAVEKVEAKFKSKKVKTLLLNLDFDMSSQKDSVIKATSKLLETTYGKMDGTGVETSVKQNDKNIHVKISLDFDKASKEDLENVDANFATSKDKKVDTKEFKEQLEKQGYTCEK